MPIELKIKNKDPKIQDLASVAFGSAALCSKYESCSDCPGSIEKRYVDGVPHYECKFGLHIIKESIKKAEGVLSEEDLANLDVRSRSYTGRETGFTLEDIAIKLLLFRK